MTRSNPVASAVLIDPAATDRAWTLVLTWATCYLASGLLRYWDEWQAVRAWWSW